MTTASWAEPNVKVGLRPTRPLHPRWGLMGLERLAYWVFEEYWRISLSIVQLDTRSLAS